MFGQRTALFYTKKFAELCQLAAQFDQDINLEFVTWAGITNLEQAAQLLRDVDLPNVGIVVDALHFHRSRVKLEELESLPKEWFRFMHLCDAVQEIPTDLDVLVHDGREERLYPGEGAIDLKGNFVQASRKYCSGELRYRTVFAQQKSDLRRMHAEPWSTQKILGIE